MSVYGLKYSVLKLAGAKVIATDHRDTEKFKNTVHYRKYGKFKNIRIRGDGSLVTYPIFKLLLIFNGLLLLKMYVGTYETSS